MSMDFEYLRTKVLNWAGEKGIFEKATEFTQLEKTQEELKELSEAIHAGSKEDIMLELGDVIVTLIIQAAMQGECVEDCLNLAYEKIKNRKGKMIDGFFVKD